MTGDAVYLQHMVVLVFVHRGTNGRVSKPAHAAL